MSIKVVDIQNEAVENDAPIIETVEEVAQPEPTNEVVEEVVEAEVNEVKEEVKEDASLEARDAREAKPKRLTQKDKMNCPKCFKEMTVKSFRCSHEENCQGQLTDKPVKPHTNPKPKTKPKTKPKQPPKPPPSVYYSDSSSEEEVIIRRKKKPPQQPPQPSTPSNPLTDITNHYQLLHQQMLQQKQERYNNLCKNIFAPRVKKR